MTPPHRFLLLLLVAVFLGSTPSTLSISSASPSPVELTGKYAPHPHPQIPLNPNPNPPHLAVTSHPPSSFHLPPAAPVAGEGSGGGPFCTRVHLRGHASRLRDPSRFFHALRVRANASRPNALELCFHR